MIKVITENPKLKVNSTFPVENMIGTLEIMFFIAKQELGDYITAQDMDNMNVIINNLKDIYQKYFED